MGVLRMSSGVRSMMWSLLDISVICRRSPRAVLCTLASRPASAKVRKSRLVNQRRLYSSHRGSLSSAATLAVEKEPRAAPLPRHDRVGDPQPHRRDAELLLDYALQMRNWPPWPAYHGLEFFVRGDALTPGPLPNLGSKGTSGGWGAGTSCFWVDPARDVCFVPITVGSLEDSDHLPRTQRLGDIVLGNVRVDSWGYRAWRCLAGSVPVAAGGSALSWTGAWTPMVRSCGPPVVRGPDR